MQVSVIALIPLDEMAWVTVPARKLAGQSLQLHSIAESKATRVIWRERLTLLDLLDVAMTLAALSGQEKMISAGQARWSVRKHVQMVRASPLAI